MSHLPQASANSARNSWWREPEWLLLVLLVGGIYFTRLDMPTLRGEETRWGTCARLHLELGDWAVPRQQGRVFPERPPLGNWLMALFMLVLGESSPWAVRLPSAVAMLGTTTLVYAYSRRFLARGGALAAGAAMATMGEVMVLGRLGESEAVFTLLVSASLLVWHWGYSAGWSKMLTWSSGFTLAALAGLVKGPQGPIYFVAITGFYLLFIERNWRYLVHPAYLAGLALFLLIVGLWQMAFYRATGLEESIAIWAGLASDRYHFRPATFFGHLAGYPFEILIATLPWSLFLVGYLYRSFRQQLGAARPHMVFVTTALAIAFLPLWLAAGARTRYFMPLYPALAVLVGVAIETCWRMGAARLADRPVLWQLAWRRFAMAMAAAMVLLGVGILLISSVPNWRNWPLAQGLPFAALYCTACLLLAAALWQAWLRTAEISSRSSLEQQRAGILSVAAFLGLTSAGLLINTQSRAANDVESAVARLKMQLPADVQLVSFRRTHHMFAWHYGRLIPVLDWPRDAASVPAEVDYFCFEDPEEHAPPLPFAWEQIAAVSCDRNRRQQPRDKVVIGRVLRDAATAGVKGPVSR